MSTTIGISETVLEELQQYRDRHEHTSYDSAIRELLCRVEDSGE